MGRVDWRKACRDAGAFPFQSGWGVSWLQRPPIPALQRISKISVPTLIISGERDHPDARNNADRAATTIPRARKVVIPGAAHLVNVDQPEEFNRIVLDFLSNVRKMEGANRKASQSTRLQQPCRFTLSRGGPPASISRANSPGHKICEEKL